LNTKHNGDAETHDLGCIFFSHR